MFCDFLVSRCPDMLYVLQVRALNLSALQLAALGELRTTHARALEDMSLQRQQLCDDLRVRCRFFGLYTASRPGRMDRSYSRPALSCHLSKAWRSMW